VPVSVRGVAFYSQVGSHIVVDITGWYTGTPLPALLGVPANPAPGLPPPPTRLVVPRLGLDTDLAWASSLDDLFDNPGWLPGSGLTGTPGNMVIAGHRVSHTHPFRFIDAMQPGDEFYVYADGKYTYQVVGSVVVSGDDYNAIVASTAEATVTLYACHPPGSVAQRWLVKADYLGDY
jgi:sortase A